MRLIWRNCLTYNQDGAEIYTIGKKLQGIFEERFAKVVELSKLSLLNLILSS